jgi:hypothetical protein
MTSTEKKNSIRQKRIKNEHRIDKMRRSKEIKSLSLG